MENGTERHELRHDEAEEEEENLQAWELVHSLILPMLVRTACELGIPEILHDAAGPLSAHQIAQKLQSHHHDEDEGSRHDAQISAANLDRVLRCLAAHGVLRASASDQTCPPTTVYHSTRLLSWLLPVLHSPHLAMPHASPAIAQPPSVHTPPPSFRGMLMLHTSPTIVNHWLHLSPFLTHGPPNPFHRANSLDIWDYALCHPSFAPLFNDAMSADSISVTALLCRYKGFAEIRSLVDVGGGDGLAAAHIAAAYPSLKVTCFDLPHIIAKNSTQFPGVDYVGGDMFQSIPEADGIFIKRVLHTWSDNDCIKTLNNCHKSLPRSGKLIIVEVVLENNAKEMNRLSKFKTMLDVIMLSATSGGKERTILEWTVLLTKSNFLIQKIIDLPSGHSVIEARAMENGTINRLEISC